MSNTQELIEKYQDTVAVIAMAGRFPGANSVEKFWENLEQGIESITFFDQEELLKSGVAPDLLENPNMIGAEGILTDVEKFDAEFFGFSPREAELLDPQHRIFLETTWELLERAGYSSDNSDEIIGVYSGAGASSYLARNLLTHPDLVKDVGTFKLSLSTDQGFISTRASYKLGLTGPSINVNTLCSSSLVALHYAREALLAYQCDIAVAGGVTISNAREDALYYQEGGIGSFDGHCRAFDARAAGTVAGNGIAMVALKRTEDAITDGDQILGIVRGSAVNNDGADKSSYTAPSPEGQARAITEAIEVAEINPETITYVETHGTGTNLGDPIEVSGLSRAYRRYTDKTNFCGIGSVKTNIGHLVAAAGVASMIKTLMGMKNKKIPASLNFEKPNPKIDFEGSPFYVVNKTQEWRPAEEDCPLRAGVSSFGIGGTNAHVILEEAPTLPVLDKCKGIHTVILSAKSSTALQKMKTNLAEFIRSNPSVNIADLAYTLQVGRRSFQHRFSACVSNYDDLLKALDDIGNKYTNESTQKNTRRDVCFMFPGQGSQYPGMAKALYESEPIFKQTVDQCLSHIDAIDKDLDLLNIIFPHEEYEEQAIEKLKNTKYSQLSLFITEYALSQLWMSWGINPNQMIGHSIGEYVAACISGVFSLEDALRVVAKRGELMAEMPEGSMVSVSMAEEGIQKYLNKEIWHSVQNNENNQVLSGSHDAINRIIEDLDNDGISVTRLHTSHAFHSGMMDNALPHYKDFLDGVTLHKPNIRFISNLSGDWAKEDEVTTSDYWVEHLRKTVRFGDGLKKLESTDPTQVLLEVGPSNTLSSLAKSQLSTGVVIASSLPHRRDESQTMKVFHRALASIWHGGNSIDWSLLYQFEQRRRICIPTYPFERKRYWIDAATANNSLRQSNDALSVDNSIHEAAGLSGRFKLNTEIKPNTQMEVGQLSPEVWEDIKSLQSEFSERLQNIVGDEFSIRTSEIELSIKENGEEENKNINDFKESVKKDNAGTSIHSRPKGAALYVPPETETQSLLASHWEAVLGYSPVGIHDNFFDVGGHSIMAADLVTKTRNDFDIRIPIKELLENPTIAQLSELIENFQWLESPNSSPDGEEVLEL